MTTAKQTRLEGLGSWPFKEVGKPSRILQTEVSTFKADM